MIGSGGAGRGRRSSWSTGRCCDGCCQFLSLLLLLLLLLLQVLLLVMVVADILVFLLRNPFAETQTVRLGGSVIIMIVSTICFCFGLVSGFPTQMPPQRDFPSRCFVMDSGRRRLLRSRRRLWQ